MRYICDLPNRLVAFSLLVVLFIIGEPASLQAVQPKDTSQGLFEHRVKPLIEKHCIRCHNTDNRKGKLALDTHANLLAGGVSGKVVSPGDPEDSELIWAVRGPDPEMPKKAKPLSKQDVATLEQWIKAGATWPKGMTLKDKPNADLNWWSLKPLQRPTLPTLAKVDQARVRTPIDAFILNKLREKGLEPSPPANRRTLIRRLYFDLIGLPPTPAQVNAFINNKDPKAYEKLVDKLLASKHYGERWARHWLDVVHYGDTHGYDKDKLRPNAWPYRDYVIRAFNEDKTYSRFIKEQIAGDRLWPHTTDGVVATGFLAAGPWDFIGHAEVPESKIDGKVARHTDRDDMVRTVFETFTSTTVGCAQCHPHKFDPVSMEDYYNAHAIFAAIDRADRDYEPDPVAAEKRGQLLAEQKATEAKLAALNTKIQTLAGPGLAKLEQRIAAINKVAAGAKKEKPEFGYHSAIENSPGKIKWVQVDLGASQKLEHVVVVGCNDDFQQIGPGFGFPVRFKIEISDDPNFKEGVTAIADHTGADFTNPKVTPVSFAANGQAARYIRVTATKLVNRLPTDYIFALAELIALSPDGENVAAGKGVTSLDSIEAPVRWSRANLVDGYYFGVWNKFDASELAKLGYERAEILGRVMTPELKTEKADLEKTLANIKSSLSKLPATAKVYAGCVHQGSGNFRGRAGLGPRVIHVLSRGQVTQPGEVAKPGVPQLIAGVKSVFELHAKHDEGDRRVALANWLTRKDHPLTWRSIVNRLWLYHFGRGIVDSPGDFGRMGQKPTHPQLLDWLAVEFRDGGQSMKKLHRLIVLSATYQQVSVGNTRNESLDADNRFMWRASRRQLEAEAIRDTVLQVAGKLDTKMGGPAFRDFVIEKPEHSPHFMYDKYNPDDPSTHRRSVYRFIVRSQPQPFMDTLDCADPSQMVAKRNHTLTPLQALALMNNRFMLRMCEHMAARFAKAHRTIEAQVAAAFSASIGRDPDRDELDALTAYATEHGLPSACRVILNMNEFVFLD